MARCNRCNKFLLFSTKSGYCANCDILIANENAEKARKAREEAEKRLRDEEEKRRAEEERRIRAEEARKAEEELQRKAKEAREAEEERRRKAAEEEERARTEKAEQEQHNDSASGTEDAANQEDLDNLTKEAMKDASLLLDKVLDLLKSLFAYSCRDFTVSYRLSEENIDNFVQLRHAVVLYFARLIAGVNMTIGASKSETPKLVEQLAGEELSTDIDYIELEPLELSHHDIPWAMQYFVDIDEFSFNDPKLNLDSLTFTPLFLKMLISITGRIQQMHMDILTKENNQIISEYTDVITEHYVDEAERITGVRPKLSVTTATVTRNDDGDVTKVVINKDKDKTVSSESKEG